VGLCLFRAHSRLLATLLDPPGHLLGLRLLQAASGQATAEHSSSPDHSQAPSHLPGAASASRDSDAGTAAGSALGWLPGSALGTVCRVRDKLRRKVSASASDAPCDGPEQPQQAPAAAAQWGDSGSSPRAAPAACAADSAAPPGVEGLGVQCGGSRSAVDRQAGLGGWELLAAPAGPLGGNGTRVPAAPEQAQLPWGEAASFSGSQGSFSQQGGSFTAGSASSASSAGSWGGGDWDAGVTHASAFTFDRSEAGDGDGNDSCADADEASAAHTIDYEQSASGTQAASSGSGAVGLTSYGDSSDWEGSSGASTSSLGSSVGGAGARPGLQLALALPGLTGQHQIQPQELALAAPAQWHYHMFIQMEAVAGQTLDKWMAAAGGRPAGQLEHEVFAQLVMGLAHIHSRGLLHRCGAAAGQLLGHEGEGAVAQGCARTRVA